MDDRFGAKPVIVFSLIVLMFCGLGMISVDRTTVFFVIKTAAAPEGALFASLPEQVFIALGAVIGAVSGPAPGLLPQRCWCGWRPTST